MTQIKTGKDEVDVSKATLGSKVSLLASLDSKVEQLVGEVTTGKADLKAAAEILARKL